LLILSFVSVFSSRYCSPFHSGVYEMMMRLLPFFLPVIKFFPKARIAAIEKTSALSVLLTFTTLAPPLSRISLPLSLVSRTVAFSFLPPFPESWDSQFPFWTEAFFDYLSPPPGHFRSWLIRTDFSSQCRPLQNYQIPPFRFSARSRTHLLLSASSSRSVVEARPPAKERPVPPTFSVPVNFFP